MNKELCCLGLTYGALALGLLPSNPSTKIYLVIGYDLKCREIDLVDTTFLLILSSERYQLYRLDDKHLSLKDRFFRNEYFSILRGHYFDLLKYHLCLLAGFVVTSV